MKVRAAAATLVIGLQLAVPAASFGAEEPSEAAGRRYSTVMVEASELRQKANQIRSEAHEAGKPNANQSEIRRLESRADELEQKARAMMPDVWPPADVK